MQFVATHNVTAEDMARAGRLAARNTDILLNIVVTIAIVAILSQVLYAFALDLRAAVKFPNKLVDLLRFETGGTATAVLSWLSIVVALLLPVFLFYSLRSLAETLRPAWRIRRTMSNSIVFGPTTYIVDDLGVRSARKGGADVFLPWTAFDAMRTDVQIAVLMRNRRPTFFVPLAAFGQHREAVLAQIRSHMTQVK